MASLSTCHLGLWRGWQILLNLLLNEMGVKETGGKATGGNATGAQVSQETRGNGDRLMGERD